MGVSIFLDDERSPRVLSFSFICRSYKQFVQAVWDCVKNGIKIDYISFDHDLGETSTGMTCVKMLVERDMDHSVLSNDFTFHVHSANGPGGENIQKYLGQYLLGREMQKALEH